MPIQKSTNPSQASNTSSFRWVPAKYDEVVDALNAYADEIKGEWEAGEGQSDCFGDLGYIMHDELGNTKLVVRAYAGQRGPRFLVQSPRSTELHAKVRDVVLAACGMA